MILFFFFFATFGFFLKLQACSWWLNNDWSGKHDSCKGSGVRVASGSFIVMIEAIREGGYALKFQKERNFHSGVLYPARIN